MNIISVRKLSKHYPGVDALKDVDLDIGRNVVHCIVGENGAGKSTFIKILTCAEKRTAGEIFLDGEPYNPKNVRDAMDAGISTLFQELNVVDQLTVEENLTLGREQSSFGVIATGITEHVAGILKDIAPDIPLQRRVSSLSFAEKQLVEIVKAISVEAAVIIMDEPTAALSLDETQRLFKVIEGLKRSGITIIYISHLLQDIFEIGDLVTVFRDGEVIGTRAVSQITNIELIKMMVGKVVVEKYKSRNVEYSRKILETIGLTTDKIQNISFKLFEGEIIGFYGFRGAGKTELSHALYGLDRILNGSIEIDGNEKTFSLPRDSLHSGIALIPEERLSEGLILKHSISANVVISNPKKISKCGVTSKGRERTIAEYHIGRLQIKAGNCEQVVSTLSGGNQQKVVIAKCINTDSKILIMDEPTRGVDVGAKEEIHNIIRALADDGVSIVVFSSEMPEILNLCDRIYLVAYGRVVGELLNSEADPERILQRLSCAERR